LTSLLYENGQSAFSFKEALPLDPHQGLLSPWTPLITGSLAPWTIRTIIFVTNGVLIAARYRRKLNYSLKG